MCHLGGYHILACFLTRLQFQDNYLAWDNPGIGRYLIFLAGEGIVFFVLVLLIEYSVFHACARSLARFCNLHRRGLVHAECSVSDDDVLAEKERVMTSEDSSDMLVIKELTKRFAGRSRKSVFCLVPLSAAPVVGKMFT